jgi:23S rRNA pseudouridine1911/1915/1917 synthase
MEPPVRCDRAVVDALAAIGEEVSRVAVQRAFAEGLVRAQGRPIAPRTRVTGPLELEVTLVPARPLAAEPEALPLSVVFEDADLLAVDKPPGMVVHASAGHAHGTLVNAVLHHLGAEAEDLPVLPGNDDTRPGIVHRLDKDTSGVMVIAKHARAQARLAEQFQRHDLFRSYLGVVIGVPAWAEMRAITDIAVHERLHAAAACTFVLHTGRTHQIRMHARHLGHPIVGDALYGPARLRDERLAEAAHVLGRQALHAAELHLAHPSTGELLRLSAPLPADITRLLDALR